MADGKWDEKFKAFLKQYYWEDILHLGNEYPEQRSIVVDFSDLEIFDRELADELLEHPDEVIPSAENALQQIDLPIDKTLDDVHVQFIKIPNKIPIRDIRSKNLLKFIAIEGMVRKATEVRPKIIDAAFLCMRCENVTHRPQTENKFDEPKFCESETCGKSGPFKILIDQSTFLDSQKLQVQESPENLKGGTQPQSLDIDVDDELAGHATPGIRLIINGILRSHQRTLREGKSTTYDLVLHANSIEYIDTELEQGKDYSYTVKAREKDIYWEEAEESEARSARTYYLGDLNFDGYVDEDGSEFDKNDVILMYNEFHKLKKG